MEMVYIQSLLQHKKGLNDIIDKLRPFEDRFK